MCEPGLSAEVPRPSALGPRPFVSALGPRPSTLATPSALRPRPSALGGTAAQHVGPEDAPLLNALKSLRTQIARAEKVPPYVVFPDKTLAEIAVRRPRSLIALGSVKGVGPVKLEKYGQRFLDVVRSSGEHEAA